MPYPYRSFCDWLSEEERNGNVLRFKQPIKLGDYSNLVDIGLKNYLPIDDPRGELEGKAPEVYAIGDCKEQQLIRGAIADGWRIGQAIQAEIIMSETDDLQDDNLRPLIKGLNNLELITGI